MWRLVFYALFFFSNYKLAKDIVSKTLYLFFSSERFFLKKDQKPRKKKKLKFMVQTLKTNFVWYFQNNYLNVQKIILFKLHTFRNKEKS